MPATAAVARRRSALDLAKGAAIVMVVLYHGTLYLQHSGIQVPLGRTLAVFSLFPMPAFFLIAGLFAVRQRQWAFPDLLRRRIVPLLYLYVLWSLIRVAFFLLLPFLDGGVGELSARDPRALLLLLVWPSSSYWFLYAMVLFALVAWATRRVPVPVRVAAAVALSAAFGSGMLHSGNTGWDRMATYYVFFEVGATFAPRIHRFIRTAAPVLLVPLLAVLAVDMLLLLAGGLRPVPGVVLVGQVAAVGSGLLLCRLLSGVRWSAWLSMLGERSLSIYLVHIFAIVPLAWAVGLLRIGWPRPVAFVLMLVLGVVTLQLALLLGRLTARASWLYIPPRRLTDLLRPRTDSVRQKPSRRAGTPTGRAPAVTNPGRNENRDATTRPV